MDNQLVDLSWNMLVKWFNDGQDFDDTVIPYNCSNEIAKDVDLSLNHTPMLQSEWLPMLESFLNCSIPTVNPRFCNQLFSGHHWPGVIGDVVASVVNTSMYTYEVAPIATKIEQTLISSISRLIGFEGADGSFFPGASYCNFMSMVLARHAFSQANSEEDIIKNGYWFISDQAHYSFRKAAFLMGLNIDHFIRIPTDHNGVMNITSLKEEMKKVSQSGAHCVFVGGTAGTTVTGAFDPLSEIAEVCSNYNSWFHVDAAMGGTVMFSDTHRYLLDGAGRADSFCWNAHKMLGVPLSCSVLLVSERDALRNTFHDSEHGDYLFHQWDELDLNQGEKSPLCGRRPDAIKLWLSWKLIGQHGFGQHVDHCFEMAVVGAQIIEDHEELDLISSRVSVCLCIGLAQNRLASAGTDVTKVELSILREVKRRLHLKGDLLINIAKINDRWCLRLSTMNRLLTKDIMLSIIGLIGETCRQVKIDQEA